MIVSHFDVRRALLSPQPSFEGPDGPLTLVDLLEDRGRLVLYHFKFASGSADLPIAGCPGCTMYIDNIDRDALRQLAHRDAAFAIVSSAPIENLEAYKKRMSWRHKWVATETDLAARGGDTHGISVFSRDAGYISHRYFSIRPQTLVESSAE